MLVTTTILVGIFGFVSCQVPAKYHGAPEGAAILSDARYLAGDGTFGAAYSQDDGVEFKEESDEYGNRKGSYSYVDPTGQRRTVSYTAGKDGFQAVGDHIPKAPPPIAPEPEYVLLPQYNSPDHGYYQARNSQPKPTYQRYYSPVQQYRPISPPAKPRFSNYEHSGETKY